MDDFIERHFIPILCTCINSSDTELVLESLMTAKALANYYPLDELHQCLNNALLHKNEDVAYLALEVLRMKRGKEGLGSIAPTEYKKLLLEVVIPFFFGSFIPQIEKSPVQKDEGIQDQITDILIRNPKYVERLQEIKSKYRIE